MARAEANDPHQSLAQISKSRLKTFRYFVALPWILNTSFNNEKERFGIALYVKHTMCEKIA